ncbi:hypothetical protein QBC98_007585 [Kitasatospora acidiphila]
MTPRNTPTSVGRTALKQGVARAEEEHPHVGGEDVFVNTLMLQAVGTPPRRWGGHPASGARAAEERNTPTSVGRTSRASRSGTPRSEHPHVGGEDALLSNPRTSGIGTPPRRWGGLACEHPDNPQIRNTPTSVGRTHRPTPPPEPGPEHPHVGGEDLHPVLDALRPRGTPPRRWGGLPEALALVLGPRNTPTSVGRTTSSTRCSSASAEHPHVGGEDRWCSVPRRLGRGTPPRRWGGRVGHQRHQPPHRNTPTSVGRTYDRIFAYAKHTEHPHVGGEDHVPSWRSSKVIGTPPRRWGGLQHPFGDRRPVRNTPTSVGRTSGAGRSRPSAAEHPHVGGEDAHLLAHRCPSGGTPPRRWGGRARLLHHGPAVGNTPTSVGRTLPDLRLSEGFACSLLTFAWAWGGEVAGAPGQLTGSVPAVVGSKCLDSCRWVGRLWGVLDDSWGA